MNVDNIVKPFEDSVGQTYSLAITDTDTHTGLEIPLGRENFASCLVTILNELDQSVAVTVQGRSGAHEDWQTAESATTVAAAAAGSVHVTRPWGMIRLSLVCSVAPTTGTVQCLVTRVNASAAALTVASVDVSDRIGRLVGKSTNYDVLANGTITALNGTVEIVCAGMGTVGLGVSGTWVGTLVAEIDVGDGVWDPIPLIENTLAEASLNTSANGNWLLGVAGALTLRIRASALASGTATIYLNASAAAAGVFLSRSIPTGLNSIGTVGLDASENHVGQVGSPGDRIVQTPAITAGAYSAGDNVGGLLTFANAARVSAKGGVITDIIIIDDAGQDVELELWLFNQTFTAGADNAAWAATEAELHNLVAVVSTASDPLGGWKSAGTPSVCHLQVKIRYDLTGTSLFGRLVTRGTPTFVATDDVTVIVAMLQD